MADGISWRFPIDYKVHAYYQQLSADEGSVGPPPPIPMVMVSQLSGQQFVWERPRDSYGAIEADFVLEKYRHKLEPFIGDEYHWVFTTSEGETQYYDSEGRLLKVVLKDGFSKTFQHLENTVIITDHFGNEMVLNLNQFGQVTSAVVEGLTFSYSYDDAHRLTGVTYPDTSAKLYHYEDPIFTGALTGITDQEGIRIATWQYDQNYRAILSEHVDGAERVKILYENESQYGERKATVTNALGKSTIYHISLIEGLMRVVKVEGQPSANCIASNQAYEYFTSSNTIVVAKHSFVKSKTNWEGKITEYDYNDKGQRTVVREAVGTELERDILTEWHGSNESIVKITESGGREIVFDYNDKGLINTRTTGGRILTYTYYDNGQVKTIDGSRNDVSDITTFEYDTQGRLSSVVNALGHESRIDSYNAYNRPGRIINSNNVVTELGYDDLGRLISSTVKSRQGDAVTLYQLNNLGAITQIQSANGYQLNYEYDDARRLVAIEDGQANRIEYALDRMDNRVEKRIFGSDGTLRYQHNRVFDELGRTIKNIGAANQINHYAYDFNDNVTSTIDARGYSWVNAIDVLGRLESLTDPLESIVAYEYDLENNLTQVVDPRGIVTRYQYNINNEVVALISPDSGTTVYTHDSAGNVKTRTDARNVITTYTRDALNRITSISYSGDSSRNVVFTYDQANLSATATDLEFNAGIGRLTHMQDHSGTTNYRYDDRGNRISESKVLFGNASEVGYSYDLVNNVVGIKYPGNVVERRINIIF